MTNQITISGKRLVYHTHGKGEPVMFVHGFGETSDVWTNQVEYLKSKCRLIVPDLPAVVNRK